MLTIQSTLIIIAEANMTQRQVEEEPWRAPGHGRPGTPYPAPATTYHPLSTTSPDELANVTSTSNALVPPVRLRRVRPQRSIREGDEDEYEVEYPPPLAPAPVRRPLPVRPAVLPPTVSRPRVFRPVALPTPARQQLHGSQGRVARVPRQPRMPDVRPWWGAAPLAMPVMLVSLGFERRCPGCGCVMYVGGLGTVLHCPACGLEY